MKVQIRKIRPEGLDLEECIPVERVGQAQKDNIRFVAPIAIKAKVIRSDDEIIAMVSAGSRYEAICDRCLDEVTRDWETDFSLSFEIEKRIEFIELDEDIRQEIILNLPARIFCRKDCKGLCIDCGSNLNSGACACMQKTAKNQKVKVNS